MYQTIVHCFTSISLFATHWSYGLILEPIFSIVSPNRLHHTIYDCMNPYNEFFNCRYITFFLISSGTNCSYYPLTLHIRSTDASNILNITKSSIYACKYAPVTSDVPTARCSHAPITKVIESASMDTVGEVMSSFCIYFSVSSHLQLISPKWLYVDFPWWYELTLGNCYLVPHLNHLPTFLQIPLNFVTVQIPWKAHQLPPTHVSLFLLLPSSMWTRVPKCNQT